MHVRETNHDRNSVIKQLYSQFYRTGEITSGILCANLPVLPRFFTHFGSKITTRFRGSYLGRFLGTRTRSSDIKSRGLIAVWRKPQKHSLNNEYLELNGRRTQDQPLSNITTQVSASLSRKTTVEERATSTTYDLKSYPAPEIRETVL